MKLIIDISENDYELALRNDYSAIYKGTHIAEAIKKGVPLPKGHGDLIDRSTLAPDTEWSEWYDGWVSYSYGQIADADVIVEAAGGKEE